MVDLGLIDTKALRNPRLSASANGYTVRLINFCVLRCELMTYLIISCDKLRYCVKSACSREFLWTYDLREVQLLLLLLFCQWTSHCRRFLFFHFPPYWTWDRPMVNWYIFLFAPFLVKLIVLTNMQAAGGVSSFMECFSLSMHFYKFVIIPCTLVSNVTLYIFHIIAYLHGLHHLPLSVMNLSVPILNFTVTLSDIIVRRSRVKSFLTGFSSSSGPR